MRSRTRRPCSFGVLQEISVEISGDVKELYGQNQFAEAVARGKAKIAVQGQIRPHQWPDLNDLFFGQTVSSGIWRCL
jgi:hypothetical protein